MSGLAHTLEAEGIATIVIGLIPQHVKAMRPPRALLVPFELGRPLGAPGDSTLQREVIDAALNLLQRQGPGPLVETFEHDVPEASEASEAFGSDREEWACPVTFPVPSTGTALGDRLTQEIGLLMPWLDRGRKERGHTGADVSGLDIDTAATWLSRFLEPPAPNESPIAEVAVAETFKLAVEDLKAFYLEAATAQPNPGSATDVNNWFWDETAAGDLLWELRDGLSEHPDDAVRRHAQFTLVPSAQIVRKG